MAIKPLTKTQLRDWIRTGNPPPVEYLPETSMDGTRQWYAAMTEPQREKLAQSELIDRGFGVYLPQYRLERVIKRKNIRKIVSRPLFSRYLFVEAPPNAWHRLNSTKGIESIVLEAATGIPLSIPPLVIQTLLDRQNAGVFDRMMKPKGKYAPGDEVLVTKGPFFAFKAMVLSVLDDKHADLEVMMFGREHTVSMPIEHFESV